MKQEHANRLEQDLEQKRQRLEDMRQQKSHKDVSVGLPEPFYESQACSRKSTLTKTCSQNMRESQLSEMHAREAAAAEARTSISEPQSPTSPTTGDKGTAQAPATAPSGAKA